MAIREIKLPPFSGTLLNAAAATIQISNIPQGYIYKMIYLLFTGNLTKAHVANILMTLGGKPIIPNMTGNQLDTIYKYQGEAAAASILAIPFYQASAATEAEGRIGEIDTTPVDQNGQDKYSEFTLSLTTDSSLDYSASTVTAWALVDDDPKPVLPLANGGKYDTRDTIRGFVKQVRTLGNTGDNPFTLSVGADNKNHLRQAHIFHSNITSFEAAKGEKTLIQRETIAGIQFVQARQKRAVQSGHLCLDFVKDGMELNALSILKDDNTLAAMLWNSIQSGSDNLTIYSDVYAEYKSF